MASASNLGENTAPFNEIDKLRTFIRDQGYCSNLCSNYSPTNVDWKHHYSVFLGILENIKECPNKLSTHCLYKTFYFCSLVTHVKTFHKQNIVFISCDICEEIYFDPNEFMNHAQLVHSTLLGPFMSIQYKCEKCDPPTLYSTMFNLLMHYRETHISYTCFVCDAVFPSKGFLHHVYLHTKLHEFYRCQICSKKTACRSALDIHYVYVHQYWPYECRMCDTRFRLESEFYQHYKTLHKVPEPGIYYCYED